MEKVLGIFNQDKKQAFKTSQKSHFDFEKVKTSPARLMVHQYLKVGKIHNKDTWQCSNMNKTGLAVWNNGTPVLESGKNK